MRIRKAFSYDDVLLVPKYSEIEHRGDVDTSVDLGRGIKLKIPIISANMKFVTGPELAEQMYLAGGMALLHRFNDHRDEDYKKAVNDIKFKKFIPSLDRINHIGISVGVTDSEKKYFEDKFMPIAKYIKIICIDIAHGHHKSMKEMIKFIRDRMPDVLIIAGNVATADGAAFLGDSGADVIKSGIGAGSCCSTRTETGNGVPSLTSLEDCRDGLDRAGFGHIPMIADGGLKKAGDCLKSLCFANAVMIGNLLAGTDEAPGDIIMINGHKHKQYAGSSTHKATNVEGVSGYVPYRGPVKEVLLNLMDGIRSGCSYQGVSNLEDLKIDPEFVEISNSGLVESRPHSIVIG